MDHRFRIEIIDGVCLVTPAVKVESLDWELIDAAADEILQQTLSLNPPLLVFDLTEVHYFGSIFVSLLLRCWKRVSQAQGRFALGGITSPVREILTVLHLSNLWPLHLELAQAIEFVRNPPAEQSSSTEPGPSGPRSA